MAAPVAAGSLNEGDVLVRSLVAVAAFALASSAAYLLNDVTDREIDRAHPTKRMRPVASGSISVPIVLVASATLAVASLAVSLLARPQLTGVIAAYLGLAAAYSLTLKHLAVLDIAIVASGFLLRGIAGGVASGIPLSSWFLLVTSFGSLFVVGGKRYSELLELGERAVESRPTLAQYSLGYLRFVWGVSAGLLIMSYSLWASDVANGEVSWSAASVAPFVLAVLRYAMDVDAGRAGAPEETFRNDRLLWALGVIWVLLFALQAFDA